LHDQLRCTGSHLSRAFRISVGGNELGREGPGLIVLLNEHRWVSQRGNAGRRS